MMFIKKIRNNKLLLIMIFILLYLFLYYDFYMCNYISQDEGYQLALNNWSFKEIIIYCADDYHVPLFAILVKIFSYLPVSDVLSSRILLSLIVIMHFIIAFFPMERLTNRKVSLIYAILFLLSFFLPYYIIYIRMFSLANLSLLCVFLYGFLTLKYNKKSDWIKLVIFSILSCYSFLLSMCITFMFLIIFSLYCLCKKNYLMMRKYILCFGIVFLVFCPWIPILFKQIVNLQSGRYWNYFPVGPIFFINIVSIFVVNHLGRFCSNQLIWSIYIAFLLLIVFAILYNKFYKKNKFRDSIFNVGILMVILSFLGILFYTYITKAFAFRYFSIIYSLVLFLIIYYFHFNYNNFLKIALVLFIFLFAINYYFTYWIISYEYNSDLDSLNEDIKINSNDNNVVIFHPFEKSLEILQYEYLNKYKNYILYDNLCTNQVNVLRDYDLFGDNVYVLDEVSDMTLYIDEFYMINIVDNNLSSSCLFEYFDSYKWDYKLINSYKSGYNNIIFDLYKIKVIS